MKACVVFLLILCFATSCSIDYDTSVTASLSDDVPSSILQGVKQYQMTYDSPRVSLEASQAIIWENKGETQLIDVTFKEYDENHNVITSGEGSKALIQGDNNAFIEGPISGYSTDDGTELEADSLIWNNDERILSSDEVVEITTDGKSTISGLGFEANFYTNSSEFKENVTGDISIGGNDD